MTKIVAIAGSPSHPSRSYAVLEQAQAILQDQGISLDILLVRDLPAEALLHAQFDHPAITAATAQVTAAAAVIISTPVYKAAYTGILKAFLDLLPQKALIDKPVLPIATGGTLAHLLAIDYALNPVLRAIGATHIHHSLYLVDTQFQRLEQGGINFHDPDLKNRFHNALVELAQRFPAPAKAAKVMPTNGLDSTLTDWPQNLSAIPDLLSRRNSSIRSLGC
jgi:FMN reductase